MHSHTNKKPMHKPRTQLKFELFSDGSIGGSSTSYGKALIGSKRISKQRLYCRVANTNPAPFVDRLPNHQEG